MFKRALSLCLVLALLICCSPIQVHAAATGTTVLIGAGIAAAAVLTGLGIKAAQNDSSVFDALVDSVTTAWTTAGLVTNNIVTMLRDPVSGVYKIRQALVQTAFDYAYSSGSLSSVVSSIIVNGVTFSSLGYMLPLYVQRYKAGSGDKYTREFLVISDSIIESSSSAYVGGSYDYNGVRYYWNRCPVSGTFPYDSSLPTGTVSQNFVENYIKSNVLSFSPVASGLESAGTIAAPGSVVTGYPDWAAGSSEEQNPDDPEQVLPYWPIGLPASVAGAGSLTQSDVWQGIGDFVETVPATLDTISGTLTGIGDKIGSIGQDLFDGFERLIGKVHVIGTDLIAGTTALKDKLTSVGSDLLGGLTGIKDKVVSVGQDLIDKFSSVGDLLQSWSAGVTDFFSRTWTTFKEGALSFWNSTTSTLSDILEWVKSLPAAIAQAFSTMLTSLFVPDLEVANDTIDLFKSKFGWWHDIYDYFTGWFESILVGNPPKIPIHLGASRGKYNYGGDEYILDMSWYSEYKPYVDGILSGILWIFFLWRVFKHLPDTIAGLGMNENQMDSMR